MSSTLDDFFGNGEKVCYCGATENLVGIGWNAFDGCPDQYMCRHHYDEMKAQQAEQEVKAAAQERSLNDYLDDTMMEGE